MENNMMNEKESMAGKDMMKKGRCWHWTCCILPILSCLMWLAAIASFVISWISITNESGEVAGYGPQLYIWNAVMLGILALYGAGKKMGSCRGGMCGCKGDCTCKAGACVCK